MNDHLSGKELFIRIIACAFRKQLSVYVFSYFPFGFDGSILDLIVSVPGHCLSFYFPNVSSLLADTRHSKTNTETLEHQKLNS